MSAFVAVNKGDAGWLFADAAYYRPRDGVLTEIASKIITFDKMPCAMTGRGESALWLSSMHFVSHHFDVFDTFQILFEKLTSIVEPQLRGRLGDKTLDVEFCVVGWSRRRNRPVIFTWQGWGDRKIVEHDGLAQAGPMPDMTTLEAHCYSWPAGVGEYRESDAVATMEAFRRTPMALHAADKNSAVGHGVGGFIERAIVNSTGVTTEILRRWPDTVGKTIRP